MKSIGAHITNLHEGTTYADLYLTALRRRPNNIAMVWSDQALTYSALLEQIGKMVAVLKSLGLTKGDTVAHLSYNSPEPIITWVSCAILGLRYTPLHPIGSSATDAFCLLKAKVRAVVIDAFNFSKRAKDIIKNDNGVAHVLDLSGSGYGTDLEHLRSLQSPGLVSVEASVEDVIAIFFTGGTTGEPKGVMHNSRSLVTNALVCSAEWDWPKKIDFLAMTPISHAMGYIVLPILMRGGTVHLRQSFSPEIFCDAIQEKHTNMTFAVPTMIYAILDMPGIKKVDLSYLEVLIYGAAPISLERQQQALDLFGPVLFQGYGQTEAPNCVTALPRRDHHGKALASCGRPLAGTMTRILNQNNVELPFGEIGEICFRGPLIMAGYLDNPTATEAATRGGWLHTGDVGYQDAEGFIYIVDRLKDMIITGGFNVYPKEVEDAIVKLPQICDVAVVGTEDIHWGEAVCAVIVTQKTSAINAELVKEHVKKELGSIAAPKHVFVQTDPLPTTPLGKPDKKQVRKLIADKLHQTVI